MGSMMAEMDARMAAGEDFEIGVNANPYSRSSDAWRFYEAEFSELSSQGKTSGKHRQPGPIPGAHDSPQAPSISQYDAIPTSEVEQKQAKLSQPGSNSRRVGKLTTHTPSLNSQYSTFNNGG